MNIELLYLIAAVFFIIGIKQLTKPKTASRGNAIAALGMLVAVIAALLRMQSGDPSTGVPAGIGIQFIIAGILVGAGIGSVMAWAVAMTAMPQLVAIFNGFGGAASSLVALSYSMTHTVEGFELFTLLLSIIIGTVTFTGSIVAFLKLQDIASKPLVFRGAKAVNTLLAALLVITAGKMMLTAARIDLILILLATAFFLGILLTTPIGGADMPVVISLLNSYSGLAAAATGFAIGNTVLIVGGALVGASGLILTKIMCKAMNRSLANVMFGSGKQVEKEQGEYTNVKEASPEEASLLLDNAKSVIIIPGYGMAVSQAQFAVHELASLLEKKGAKVRYAIHPVAGRMPGHMNVVLAEANVPYDKLYDLDSINSEFRHTDMAIVIGANDVTNPAATQEKSSPIYGMPILNAHEAKSILIIKRSLSPGFAGIKNSLFEYPNAQMVFGDAKKVMHSIIQELKEI
ncbi:MAG TPA: NAD(P)(+) transhydrogenase (Re/Si-specific) subunit beta [Candidatus Nanoarchaeia archaeon]|nr:NAD(P)(+) transhydrogenase (Re/Si-specific) subunit beta [Candidatus Nanoarchaeia archaeon]